MWTRRTSLKLLAGGLARHAFAQSPLSATRLTPNTSLITGAGASVLALTTAEGALLVDGGLPEYTDALLKLVGAPVHVLFNTHWRPHATGSNEALAAAGAKIVAHQYTKEWLGNDFHVRWEKRDYRPRPKTAWPTETFRTSGKMTFGGEAIEYGYLGQATTDSDIYVYLPGPNILMAGDVVTVGQYPVIDFDTNGWIGGLAPAQKKLLEVAKADTKIVAGTAVGGKNPVITRAELETQYNALDTIRDRLIKLIRQGKTAKQFVEAKPTAEFDALFGDPTAFVTNSYMGLWAHVREIGGIV